MRIHISDAELSKFAPYVDKALENGHECALIKVMYDKFPSNLDFYNVIDYTLDSYNHLCKCMRKWEAKENCLYNGIEYIVTKHYTEEYEKGNLTFGTGDDKDD